MPPRTPSLFSTILSLLLPSCLRADDDHNSAGGNCGRGKGRTITCNQYEGRIYLRPIMPVATRRRSRLLSEGGAVEGKDAGGGDNGRARVDSARVDEGGEMLKKEDDVPIMTKVEGTRGSVLEQDRDDVEVEDRRLGPKQQTFSMEMHEAIEALHREEEEDDEHIKEENSDASTPSSTSSGPALEIDEGESDSLPSTPRGPATQEVQIVLAPQTKEPEPEPKIPILPVQGIALTASPHIASTPPSQTNRSDMYCPAPRVLTHVPERERFTAKYQCDKCEAIIKIQQGEPMRCKECGGMMMWKVRTKRMMMFEAR